MLCDRKTTIVAVSGVTLIVVGAGVFGAGMLTRLAAVYYSGIGIMSVALSLIVYLLCTLRRNVPAMEFPAPAFPPYIYTTPGMKRNKSDTSLELMSAVGSPKTDENGRVLSLSLV
jgi:hypothetical protein